MELRLRRQVSGIHYQEGGRFSVELQCWEPKSYVTAVKRENALYRMAATATTGVLSAAIYSFWKRQSSDGDDVISQWLVLAVIGIATSVGAEVLLSSVQTLRRPNQRTPLASLVEKAGVAVGSGHVSRVPIQQMLVGGSGAPDAVKGVPTGTETVKARFIINCAGGASDQVARMIGDDSFKIKPRVGDYILLNRNQVCTASNSVLQELYEWNSLLVLTRACCFLTGQFGNVDNVSDSRSDSRKRRSRTNYSVGQPDSWPDRSGYA